MVEEKLFESNIVPLRVRDSAGSYRRLAEWRDDK